MTPPPCVKHLIGRELEGAIILTEHKAGSHFIFQIVFRNGGPFWTDKVKDDKFDSLNINTTKQSAYLIMNKPPFPHHNALVQARLS